MGSRFSSFKTSQENETEVDYDKVYQLRSQLFPDVIDDELLRLALKDRVSSFNKRLGTRVYNYSLYILNIVCF